MSVYAPGASFPSGTNVAVRPSRESSTLPRTTLSESAPRAVSGSSADGARTVSCGSPNTTSCGSTPISIERCCGMTTLLVSVRTRHRTYSVLVCESSARVDVGDVEVRACDWRVTWTGFAYAEVRSRQPAHCTNGVGHLTGSG